MKVPYRKFFQKFFSLNFIKSFEVRISILYIFIGSVWILFSDKIVLQFTHDIYTIQIISIYKGWFYVLVTGFLLYVLIKNEIKKRNAIYHELFISNKKALESDQLKTAFLRNISHYIRTPMNSILGFVELLENRNIDNEKRNQFHQIINEQSKRLLELINDIIDISKLNTGQMEMFKKRFHINPIMHQLFLKYNISNKELGKQLIIRTKLALSNENDMIFSDEEKIKRVLDSLLSNALKFTKQGEIEFGYIFENNSHTFYVKDTGKGISDNIKDQIFNKFMLSSGVDDQTSHGSGLGLYLASGLIKLLNGKLWVEYSSPEGSKFCFSIPSRQAV